MSAQEKVGGIRAALKPLYAPTLVLLTLLLVKQTSWIWDNLYFQRHLASELSVALGLLAVLVVVGVALLRRLFGQAAAIKLINIGIAMLLTLIGFRYLQQFELLPSPMSTLHKSLAVLFALLAGFMALRIRFDMWRRIYPAAIVAGLVFIFSLGFLRAWALQRFTGPAPVISRQRLLRHRYLHKTPLFCFWMNSALARQVLLLISSKRQVCKSR